MNKVEYGSGVTRKMMVYNSANFNIYIYIYIITYYWVTIIILNLIIIYWNIVSYNLYTYNIIKNVYCHVQKNKKVNAITITI
jgi:hypothetical protein